MNGFLAVGSERRTIGRLLRVVTCAVTLTLVAGGAPALGADLSTSSATTTRTAADLPLLDSAPLAPPAPAPVPSGDFSNPPSNSPGAVTQATTAATSTLPAPAVTSGTTPTGFVASKSVEDASRRTAQSKTFRNPDGSYTAQISADIEHYWTGSGWADISNRLVANPGGGYRNEANSFTAHFRPSIVAIDTPQGTISLTPAGGTLGAPTVDAAGTTATYSDVWPGVDVQYRVVGGGVKEDLVLRRRPSTAQFSFQVQGTSLSVQADGSLATSGAFAGKWKVPTPEVFSKDGQPLATAAPRFSVTDTTVTLAVDASWLSGLDETKDLPVTLDPSILSSWSTTGRSYERNPNDNGYITCDSIPSPCQPQVGIQDYTNGWRPWRSVQYFPYESLYGKQILKGQVLFQARQEGTPDPKIMKMYGDDVYGQFGGIWNWGNLGAFINSQDASGDTFNYDENYGGPLGAYYQNLVNMRLPYMAIKFVGDENQGFYTYKRFGWFQLQLTYNDGPSIAQPQAPTNGSHPHTVTPTLQVAPATDPNGDTVWYWFRICTGSDAESGTCQNTGWITNTQWTPAALGWNTPYYWHVYTWDQISTPITSPNWIWSVTPSNTAPTAGGLSSPATGTLVTTLTPTLIGTNGSDPDTNPPDTLQYYFRLSDTDDPEIGTVWNSGWRTSSQFVIPGTPSATVDPNVLQDGVTYSWRMYTWDGIGTDWVWTAPWTYRVNLRLGDQASSPYDTVGPVRVNLFNGNLVMKAGGPTFQTVGGPLGVSLAYNSSSPGSFPTPSPVLPSGWTLSTQATRGAAYSYARIGADSIILVDRSGAPHEYRRGGTTNTGWAPTTSDDDGILAVNAANEVTLIEGDTTYVFNSNGKLTSVTVGQDDNSQANRSSANYTFTAANPASLTDPLSGRSITYSYGSTCGAPTADMLCRVSYWDGTQTDLTYTNGQLVRITNPGAEVTDFAYDGTGRLWKVRSPLSADALAAWNASGGTVGAGDGASGTDTMTVVTYNTSGTFNGAVQNVTPPRAQSGDINRPQHTYTYTAGQTTGTTDVATAGLTGVRHVAWLASGAFPAAGQVTQDTDPTGLITKFGWDNADRLLYTIDPAGRQSSTVYDRAGRPMDQYGPAPSVCFTTPPAGQPPVPAVPQPAACTSPPAHNHSSYDGTDGTNGDTDGHARGLAVQYWRNKDLTGPPGVHATGTGDRGGLISMNWGPGQPAWLNTTSADNWAARYTGDIYFPTGGTFIFYVDVDVYDGARFYIDDQLRFDATSTNTPAEFPGTVTVASNGWHRIRLDYYDISGNASLNVQWTGPSLPRQAVNPDWISPRYGLGTHDKTDDVTAGMTASDSTSTYASPETGLATAVSNNHANGTSSAPASGLAGTTAYEAAGSGFLRRTARRLPAASVASVLEGDFPVGYWRLGEATGTTAFDASGQGANGTYQGTTTLGTPGAAVDDPDTATTFVDGGSAHVVLPGLGGFDTGLTIEAWVNPATNANGARIVDLGNGPESDPSSDNIVLARSGTTNNLMFQVYKAGVPTTVTATNALVNGVWQHLVVTMTATGAVTIYKDGAVMATGTVPALGTEGRGSNYIGRSNSPSDSYFAGSLDEVAIYDSPLPVAKVAAHYQAGHDSNLSTHFTYYGPTEAPLGNTCAGTASNQAGFLKQTTDPDPDGTGPLTARVRQYVYDARGQVTGTKLSTETLWTCTAYDSRGRTTSSTYPVFGGDPTGRTVSYNYAVGTPVGNPLVTSITDSAGTITTTVDLLGRAISYRDVWGDTTLSTYDLAGRLTDTNGPAGPQHFSYDDAGRITSQKLDGSVVATPSYSSGELATVSYPTGSGNGGNGTTLNPITRDPAGRTTGLTWNLAGSTVSDGVSRSQSGRIYAETVNDGTQATSGFTYDDTGRLISATVPGHTLAYGYDANGAACPTGTAIDAGLNTNRMSLIDNNGTPVTYCYDAADRLLQVNNDSRYAGTIGYDAHGNTTTLAGQAMTYDAADRHLRTTTTDTGVVYTRDATDRIVGRTATTTPTYHATNAGANNAGGGATLAMNRPTGAASGDILIAQVTAAGGTGTVITAPTGWQAVDGNNQGVANGLNVRDAVYWHLITPGENTTSWTWNITPSSKASGGITAYSGVDQTNPILTQASSLGSGTNLSAPQVNAGTANAMVVVTYGTRTSTTITPQDATLASRERYEASSTGQNANTRTTSDAADKTTTGTAGPFAATAGTSVTASVNRTIALKPAVTTTHYSYTGAGDTADLTLDTTNAVLERTIGLPGGVLLTKRSGGDVWSYPNIHGDIMTTANSSGAKTGSTYNYDPYGQALGAVPDNSPAANLDYAWLGQHQRPLEHETSSLATIEMGARQYLPGLGRFLGVDPVEGGCSNDYAYVYGDPVNSFDINGKKCNRTLHGAAKLFGFGFLARVPYQIIAKHSITGAIREFFGGSFQIGFAGIGPKIVERGATRMGELPIAYGARLAGTYLTVLGLSSTLLDLGCVLTEKKGTPSGGGTNGTGIWGAPHGFYGAQPS
jgi:RHS repeat-associated protein